MPMLDVPAVRMERHSAPHQPHFLPTADASQLKHDITTSRRSTNEEWLASLNERKLAELDFHDADRAEHADANDGKGVDAANRKYYATTRLSNRYLNNWIAENAHGKVFLDYACGAGFMTVKAAQAGASLAIGLDISDVSVKKATRTAAQEGVTENTLFIQGDCERTELPDNCVDTILCSGMLHHLDLSYALPELRRILKPGGVILAVEALDYNPIIKLYRLLTPALRTDWEKHHILSLADVKFARRFFNVRNITYWHLVSLFATPLRNTSLFPAAMAVADAIDQVILKIMPVSLLAWMFSFEMVKPIEK